MQCDKCEKETEDTTGCESCGQLLCEQCFGMGDRDADVCENCC